MSRGFERAQAAYDAQEPPEQRDQPEFTVGHEVRVEVKCEGDYQWGVIDRVEGYWATKGWMYWVVYKDGGEDLWEESRLELDQRAEPVDDTAKLLQDYGALQVKYEELQRLVERLQKDLENAESKLAD